MPSGGVRGQQCPGIRSGILRSNTLREIPARGLLGSRLGRHGLAIGRRTWRCRAIREEPFEGR